MMNISLDIPLHFQRAVPVFKRKHRTPVQPEIGIENFIIEVFSDHLVFQFLFRCEEQLHDFHLSFIGKAEFIIRMCVLATVHSSAAHRIVRIFFIQIIIVVEQGHIRILDRRNIPVQIPHHFKMIVHFASAAHRKTKLSIVPAIARAARQRILFKDVDPAAIHLCVAHKIACCRQSSQS